MQRGGMQLYWPPFTPFMKKLIFFTVGCFLIQKVAPYVLDIDLINIFALRPAELIKDLTVWQLLTYMFLHGGIMHIVVNMLMLWMFGAELEGYFGKAHFLFYYLTAGIFAGLVSAVCYYNSMTPIVGASGAIFALLISYGFIYPDRQILFFGIFPMKTKYFILLVCLMTFWVPLMDNSGDGVAYFAHIGGIVFGLVYMKIYMISRRGGGGFGGGARKTKQQSERDKMKARFKVITSDVGNEKIDNFWEKHKEDPDKWN